VNEPGYIVCHVVAVSYIIGINDPAIVRSMFMLSNTFCDSVWSF